MRNKQKHGLEEYELVIDRISIKLTLSSSKIMFEKSTAKVGFFWRPVVPLLPFGKWPLDRTMKKSDEIQIFEAGCGAAAPVWEMALLPHSEKVR